MSLRCLKKGSLVVRNMQKIIPINTKLLKEDVSLLRSLLKVSVYDISVICISKSRMRNLNRESCCNDHVSEVLSFPFNDGSFNGTLLTPKTSCDYNLGDIYLCPPLIEEKRLQRGLSLRVNMVRYIAHSMCHLMGYRHDTDKNWRIMFRKEQELLSLFSYVRGIKVEAAYEVKHHIPQLGTMWLVPNI